MSDMASRKCNGSLGVPSVEREAWSAGRDVRLDAMRGLMLILMAIAHIPNPLRQFTYQSIGFVSEAEGFVFLSGYVAGIIYRRLALKAGQTALWRSGAVRAGRIYLYHLGMFAGLLGAIVTGILRSDIFQSWVPLFYQNPVLALILGSTLVYQPRLLDILPMYCIFILISPLIIKLFLQGRFLVVLIVSAAVWVAAQFGLRAAVAEVVFGSLPIDFGDFDILAWQLLFVWGLFFGFRRCINRPHDRFRSVMLILAHVTVLGLFALRHSLGLSNVHSDIWQVAEKIRLGPLRLLNFAAVALVMSQKFMWPIGSLWVRALSYLGRNSLQVFSFSVVCVYLTRGLVGSWEVIGEGVKVFTVVLSLMALYIPAWLHENRARFKP